MGPEFKQAEEECAGTSPECSIGNGNLERSSHTRQFEVLIRLGRKRIRGVQLSR